MGRMQIHIFYQTAFHTISFRNKISINEGANV